MELGRRWDPVAVGGGIIAGLMTLTYLGIIQGQGQQPVWGAVAILVVGTSLAFLGARRENPLRVLELLAAGVLLLIFGIASVLTIGMPVIVAGGLCLVAAGASRPAPKP